MKRVSAPLFLRRHAGVLFYLAFAVLVVYILGLVLFNYRSQIRVRQNVETALHARVRQQAAVLSYFLSERWRDLDGAGGRPAVTACLLGTGAKGGVIPVFDGLILSRQNGGNGFYDIWLTDDAGTLLAAATGSGENVADVRRVPLHGILPDPADPGRFALMRTPVFVDEALKGYLVARVDMAEIFGKFARIGDEPAGRKSYLSVEHDFLRYWVGGIPPARHGLPVPMESGAVEPIPESGYAIVAWYPVSATDFFWLSPENPIFQSGSVAALILTFTILLWRNRETTTLLRARARTTAAQKRVLLQKTLQLQKEIDSRNEAEHLRSKAISFLHSIIETLHDPLFCKDETGRWIIVNSAFCELVGKTSSEILGSRNLDVFPEEDSILTREVEAEVFGTGGEREQEHRMERKEGGFQTILVKKSRAQDANGRPVLVGTIRDISTRKETEMALDSARKAAEEATRLKTDFMAGMSHEIRNPLNAITGLVELLSDTGLDATQKEYVHSIRHASDHLLGMIRDFLDVSRIEAGRLELEEREFDLHLLLRELIRGVSIRSRKKGVSVRLHIAGDVPRFVSGDSVRLNQILMNLLGNSEKFIREGLIRLDVRNLSEEGRRVRLVFSVMDTGIGIPKEKQAAVFKPFIQTEEGGQPAFGGSGLGLAITRELIRLMGGRIRVKSPVTINPEAPGCCFHVAIGFSVVDAPSSSLPTGDAGEAARREFGYRILLADDNELNRMVTEKMLGGLGYDVTTAANGVEVLDHLAREMVDLVILDVEMPEMDGLAATRRIRERYGCALPVLAQTGLAMEGDRERILSAGMDDYISKPVGRAELHAAIERLLAGVEPRKEERRIMRTDLDVDFEDLMIRMGERADLAQRVQLFFLKAVDDHVAGLDAAMEEGDVLVVREALHRLRGSLLQVSAGRSSETALFMETACIEEDLDAALGRLAELKGEVRKAREAVALHLEGIGD